MREEFVLNSNVFGTNTYLCHYTSFEKLCNILSTMTIRVSLFAKANDIAELESNISCIVNDELEHDMEQYIENRCGYISFSTDKMGYAKLKNSRIGYLIPSMWGIYADKSQGACLILDEKELIKENKLSLSQAKWYKFVNVSYKQFQNPKLISKVTSPEKITYSHYEHILGTKHQSWSHEQERRLIGADLPHSLSLKNGVIQGIILGKHVSLEQKLYLHTIISDFNLVCYGQIDENHIVRQEILGANIFTTDFGTCFLS